jgi:hypothetical protein
LIKLTGALPTTLSRNQRYLLQAYETSGRGRGLDYGCGDGHLVAGAVERGHDFWGTEPYYGEDGFARNRSRGHRRRRETAYDSWTVITASRGTRTRSSGCARDR